MNSGKLEKLKLEGFRKNTFNRPPHPKTYYKKRKTKKILPKTADLKKFNLNNDLSILRTPIFMHRKPPLFHAHTLFRPSGRPISAIGKRRAVVLLVDFNEKEHEIEPRHYKKLLFSRNRRHKSSLRDYYLETSWNQLDIAGDVFGWYRAPENLSYYANNCSGKGCYPHNAQKLVEDLVNLAYHDLDFSNYDKDKDDAVDILIIVFAGKGNERTNLNTDIVSHKGMLHKPIVLDGLTIEEYCMVPEKPKNDLGGFCHEIGHMLGLPDLYDLNQHSAGVGDWCLMGCGSYNNNGETPAHPSAWCKYWLGWVDPINITRKTEQYDIPEVINKKNKDKTIFRLWNRGAHGMEYFLVENRQQKGFDKFLPSNGLLIWHIDEKMRYNIYSKQNVYPEHFLVALKQADGERSLEKTKKAGGNMGDSGDVFPGSTDNRVFGGKSNPNSHSYIGNRTCVSIESISDSDDVMTAEMGVRCR